MKLSLYVISAIILGFLVITPSFFAVNVLHAANNLPGNIAKSNTAFSFDLYSRLKERKGNLFFSPYSISTALAMTYAGARGRTSEEMAKVLHFVADNTKVHEGFLALQTHLEQLENKGDILLDIANAIWCQKGEKFLSTFLDTLKQYYNSRPYLVDFQNNPELARERINSWVEKETKDRIKNLIPRGALSPFTRLVLTNAIYFKGNWSDQFPKTNTKKDKFFTDRYHFVIAPMMYQESRFKMVRFPTFRVLQLPYVGGDLSMLVFLPEKMDGLEEMEKTLDEKTFEECVRMLRQSPGTKVKVYIPRFTMTSQFDLSKELRGLGMKRAFSDADFSGMNGKKNLALSNVIHKAFIDVNEQGTEAAAATGVMIAMTAVMPRPVAVFRADHPFMFVIQDNYSGCILFMGRLEKPGN